MSGLDGRLDLDTGHISGGRTTERHLSELENVFENEAARRTLVAQHDRLVYRVSSVEAAQGDGDLHYGLGWIAPGKVGGEYHLTRGHLHAWRPAAEVYVGLRGEGLMLLEDEQGAHSRSVPLAAGQVVYVPGHTAHRTVNTGAGPLVYLGIYPARAGHDYAGIFSGNFRQVVVAGLDGAPLVRSRQPQGTP